MNIQDSHVQEVLTLEVPRHLRDTRIDSALVTLIEEKFPEKNTPSRARIGKVIEAGHILLNDKPVLPRTLVATHDSITLPLDLFEEKVQVEPVSSQGLMISILFENTDILVIDKGVGVQMHPSQSQSSVQPTVASWLREMRPDVTTVGEDPERPGIVHRLDRDTSGVLVLAKTNEAFSALKTAFQERSVSKKYVALVSGHLKAVSGSVDALLMRRPGELRRYAVDPKRFEGTLPASARTAYTEYRVIARYDKYDLVELAPKTGRTHQIRVHLAFLGHPVVGDRLYAFKEAKGQELLRVDRQLLHAQTLSFALFGKEYQFQAPLPEDFRDILKSIDETKLLGYDDEALNACLESSVVLA